MVQTTLHLTLDFPFRQVTESVSDNDNDAPQMEDENEKVCIKIEYEQLHEEHARYKEEIKSLKFALQRTAEEYAQLHQRNHECAREIQSLKSAHADSELKYKNEISAKDVELATLNEQCGLAQQQIQELQVDVEHRVEVLKKDLASKSSIEMREHEATKKYLLEVEAEKQTLADDLNSRLVKAKEDHELTKQRLVEVESKFEDTERMLRVEKEKIVSLTHELDSKSSLESSLKNEVDQLTSKVSKAEDAFDDKNKELQSMTAKADGLQSKLQQREIEIRRRVEEISVMMKQEKKLLASVQKEQLDVESKNENLKRLRSINKILSKQRDESRFEVC